VSGESVLESVVVMPGAERQEASVFGPGDYGLRVRHFWAAR